MYITDEVLMLVSLMCWPWYMLCPGPFVVGLSIFLLFVYLASQSRGNPCDNKLCILRMIMFPYSYGIVHYDFQFEI